ncbi:MAG: hypothetical protein WDO56_18665 [Gammaproteobacteria bacterium]
MFEAGQDVALLQRPFCKPADPPHMRTLQCDRTFHGTVAALGEPHAAHASFAEAPEEPVRADLRTGRFRGLERFASENFRRGVQRPVSAMRAQQRNKLGAQLGIVAASGLHE